MIDKKRDEKPQKREGKGIKNGNKKCTMQNVYSNKNKNQNPEKRNNKKWQQIYDQKLMNK